MLTKHNRPRPGTSARADRTFLLSWIPCFQASGESGPLGGGLKSREPSSMRLEGHDCRRGRPDDDLRGPGRRADVPSRGLAHPQKNCQECHRPGQVAPFALLTFEQARKRADDLASVTHRRTMPPWHASTTEGRAHSVMSRCSLRRDIATLAAWAKAGAPEGDPKDAPPPLEFAVRLATRRARPRPHHARAVRAGPEGADEHRVFVIPTGLLEGKWVAAVDYKPGNPRIVHHALGAFDTKKRGRILDAADPKPGYKVFGGFGFFCPTGFCRAGRPATRPPVSPEGVGRYLPGGLRLHPPGPLPPRWQARDRLDPGRPLLRRRRPSTRSSGSRSSPRPTGRLWVPPQP